MPLVVLEGPPGSTRLDVERMRAAGMTIRDGFRAGTRGSRVVCAGVVAGPADAEAALLTAIAGFGIVVEARAERATIDRLVDDLRRLGPVDHRVARSAPSDDVVPEPSLEARAILRLLAMDLSLAEAASRLGLPRRTADRRIAEARHALGVRRTTEAVARARQLGWLDRPPGEA